MIMPLGYEIDPEKRFAKFLKPGDVPEFAPELGACLLHVGGTNGNGYVQFRYNGRGDYAHRYAWERDNGPIPAGMTVDHLCRNKRCVKATHLELVTGGENTRRAAEARTTCRNGHALTPDNLKPGSIKACLTCRTESAQRSSRKKWNRLASGLPHRGIKYDQQAVREHIALVRSAQLTIAQAARIIGCHPNDLGRRVWNETRAEVSARDGARCLRCLAIADDPHHRRNRGKGGSALPEISFGMDNIVSVCRSCHDWATPQPEDALAAGWVIRRSDPRPAYTIPLTDLYGHTFLLTADGLIDPNPSLGVSA